MSTEQEIVLFSSADGEVTLDVGMDDDTVWLTQAQMVELFEKDQSVISRHINNTFNEGEVDKKSNMQKMHIAQSDKPIALYSLDVIISVGYRVKSQRGVEFRKWATRVLKDYVIFGAAVNKKRLNQIGTVVNILSRSSEDMISGIADVLSEFTDGLALLDNYDHQTLSKPKGAAPEWVLTYGDARGFIDTMKFGETSELFGHERDGSFKGVIQGLYQSFGGIDLYPSIQEKAANLLYLVVKDHCFTDGNKRIAAALFVYFLDKNGALRDKVGQLVIQNNTLAAITLMIALSAPEEKEVMCMLVMNMLVESN